MSKVDAVLEAIGGAGKYQKLHYALSGISAISAAFQLLNIVFVGRNIPHVCQQPANLSDVYNHIDNEIININNSIVTFEKCNIHVEANVSGEIYSSELPCLYGYQYEDRKNDSLMSDMDIVCDKAPLRSLGQTLLILGQGIGASTLTWFSDRYGRRTILVLSHAIFLCLGVGIAFVPTYNIFLVLRVILGITQQGIVLGYSTINVETFSTRYRRIGGLFSSLIWSTSACLIPLVAYLMRAYSWRWKQLAYCSVSLYVIVQFFFMDETLSWLMTNRKVERVERNLKKAAKMEGKDEEEVLEVYRKYQELDRVEREAKAVALRVAEKEQKKDGIKAKKTKDPTKPSFFDLMKRKRLALTVFVLWFTWLTDSMTYFGLYMTADTLVGDRYINVLLLSIVDAPAALIFWFMIDRYGRKKTSMLLHGVAAFGLLTATAIKTWGVGDWAGTAVTAFTCLGMFGASGAWGVTFFFTPEMFPTNLRNFGLGTSSSFSRIGGMIAPFSSLLVEYVPWGPGAIFGGCCLAVTVLIKFLPETMGRELPETLDDMNSWYKKGEQRDKYENDIKLEDVRF